MQSQTHKIHTVTATIHGTTRDQAQCICGWTSIHTPTGTTGTFAAHHLTKAAA